MAEVALEVLRASLGEPARRLLEAAADVARRLGHDRLAVEHLLVAGAEDGDPAIARVAGHLAAFREALLDLLYSDRARFKQRGGARGERGRGVLVQRPLVVALERIDRGEGEGAVLEGLLRARSPRVGKALALAKRAGAEVVPPDTQTLERERSPASVSIEGAAPAAAPQAAAAARSDGRVVPLTTDLCRDTLEDLPLVGRATALEQAARTLLRFHDPSLLLVGEPGSGLTAFVRGLARAACTGELPQLAQFRFHELRILDLVSQRHHGQDVPALLAGLLEHVAGQPNTVLVIDDLQRLLGRPGLPETGEVIDTLKLHLQRGRLRVLLTITRADYERLLAGDPYFSGEITLKRLAPLERADLLRVLQQFRPRLERHYRVKIADAALEAAVAASLGEVGTDTVPPGSTIRLLDEACALARPPAEGTVTAAHVERAATESRSSAGGTWDRERLAHLADELAESVRGQDLAAEAVARRVRLSKLHLDRKPHRPDGVFLFIGPSGVGKTEMARALARALYGNEAHLVRLDMSEYMEPHSVARISGAPPGYIGYGEEGALTGPIARLGHGVVLLDEIEKAHPQVLNLFLQVFDDGRLTDSKGREVDFSDSVIVMTSNMGRELYDQQLQRSIGFGSPAPSEGPPLDAVREHLLRVLPAEFVNRIDEVVPFRVLDEADIAGIARRMLALEVERWSARGKHLSYDAEVERLVATAGYDPRLGARNLERNVERLVISLLSDAAVQPGFESVKELRLFVEGGAIRLALDGRTFAGLARSAPADAAPATAPAPGARSEGARAAARRPPTPPPLPLPPSPPKPPTPPTPPRGDRP